MAERAPPRLILDVESPRMLIDAAHMANTSPTERADHNEIRDLMQMG
jgi:hypothetical protein